MFSGLNDGLISRAEALAAVDIKHQGTGGPGGLPQLKHDMMYHHSMGAPPPVSRPHQVNTAYSRYGLSPSLTWGSQSCHNIKSEADNPNEFSLHVSPSIENIGLNNLVKNF